MNKQVSMRKLKLSVWQKMLKKIYERQEIKTIKLILKGKPLKTQ